MRYRIGLGIAATVLLATAAWAAGMVVVDQKGLAFSTTSLTVAKGTLVSFQNSDSTSHNILVTGSGVTLNSGLQAPGVAFRAPFLKSGTYQVICGIHPKMKMTVVVR